jgi:hypothetical protein
MLDDYQLFERRLDRTNLIVIFLAVLAVAVLHSPRGAASLAVGGVISSINFRWLKQAVNHVIRQGGEHSVGPRVLLQFAGRYALIGLALYVSIRFTILDLAFLLAGLLSYILAALLECIFEIGRTLTRRDPNGRT